MYNICILQNSFVTKNRTVDFILQQLIEHYRAWRRTLLTFQTPQHSTIDGVPEVPQFLPACRWIEKIGVPGDGVCGQRAAVDIILAGGSPELSRCTGWIRNVTRPDAQDEQKLPARHNSAFFTRNDYCKVFSLVWMEGESGECGSRRIA